MRTKLVSGVAAIAVGFLLVTNPVVVDAASQITGKDIENNSIKGKDIKNDSIKGKDVKDDSLEGADINEGTLGTVPSASSATTLNGVPASSFQTQAYKFIVPADSSPSLSKTYTFGGLPAGNYVASYSVLGNIVGGEKVGCYFLSNSTSTLQEGFAYGSIQGPLSTPTASATLILSSAPPQLKCRAATNFNIVSTDPITSVPVISSVTFTRIDSLALGTTS